MKRNQTRFTTEYLSKTACASLNPHIFEKADGQKKKKSKYSNKKTEVNGITFDSIREAKRYKHLLFLQKIGEIAFLKLQVPYELNPGGTHSLVYIADFVYMETQTGNWVVEDVKGFVNATYKKKRRLMVKVHGIIIKEV